MSMRVPFMRAVNALKSMHILGFRHSKETSCAGSPGDCVRAVAALASLHICVDSLEPSLIDNAISTKISCWLNWRFGSNLC